MIIRASLLRLRLASLLVVSLFLAAALASTANAAVCPQVCAAPFIKIGNFCSADVDCDELPGDGVCGEPAETCSSYGLSGNFRFQVGDGLPIPATLFLAAPKGGWAVQPAATVVQTDGADPKKLYFRPDGVRVAARENNLGRAAVQRGRVPGQDRDPFNCRVRTC